jgi:alpha-mannosidase
LAAAETDLTTRFQVDGKSILWSVQAWDGFVGQWDNRIWKGEVPLKTFGWKNELVGLAPGFIKRAPVAWYADHQRLANGENDPYHFAYLYRYTFHLPAGAKSVTLPRAPGVKIFAATVTEAQPTVRPVHPLYDTLAENRGFRVP